jgi:hypothetical protein
MLLHRGLAILLAISTAMHSRKYGGISMIVTYASFASFFATAALQVMSQTVQNVAYVDSRLRFTKFAADVSDENSELRTLALVPARALSFRAGQYIYLTMFSWKGASWLQRHPFMLMRSREGLTNNKEENAIDIPIMKRRGWTKTSRWSDFFWIAGPYGAPPPLHKYGMVIMFASESGILAQLPFIQEYINNTRVGKTKIRRMKLVWEVDTLHKWNYVLEYLKFLIHQQRDGGVSREWY